MARVAVADGIGVMAATAHCWPGIYDNTADGIRQAVADLQGRLDAEGIALRLVPGAEIMLDERVPARLHTGELLTLGDRGTHALVELPPGGIPLCSEQVIFELQLAGITPVLAHPEKNTEVQGRLDFVATLAERGCLVQVDADSLRRPSRRADGAVRWLLEHDCVNVIASDAHSVTARPARLSDAVARAGRILGEDATALATTIPSHILGL
jgi:protein-tyrosine phosphatase